MKKFKNKIKIKPNGFLSQLFAFYSSVFSIFDDIEPFKTFKNKKTFKSMMLAFQGKSSKQIKHIFEMEKVKEQERMRIKARRELEKENF